MATMREFQAAQFKVTLVHPCGEGLQPAVYTREKPSPIGVDK